MAASGGFAHLLQQLQTLQELVLRRQTHMPICAWLSAHGVSGQMLDKFDLAASRWQHFSGDSLYPVPVPNNVSSVTTPRKAFHEAVRQGTVWDGEYGEARKALLAWVVYYMQETWRGKAVTQVNGKWIFVDRDTCNTKIELSGVADDEKVVYYGTTLVVVRRNQ